MSQRAQIRRRIGALEEIGEIMAAMKNLSVTEVHRLSRFIEHQHRVLASVAAAANDFLEHRALPAAAPRAPVVVAIGSQRGFAGDFNQAVAQALARHRAAEATAARTVVVGRRLAARLGDTGDVLEILDGPGAAAEVPIVLRRVMDVLHRAAADNVVLLAHRDGQAGITPRRLLPLPDPPGGPAPFAPLLNLPPREFFAALLEHYLWAQMHDAFYASLLAENRRRLQHLDAAMKRLRERADTLRRRHDRARQEEITEEIEMILLSEGVG